MYKNYKNCSSCGKEFHKDGKNFGVGYTTKVKIEGFCKDCAKIGKCFLTKPKGKKE